MTEVLSKNKHLLLELARASIALRHALSPREKEGMEDLIVYLAIELEKRSRFNHYYQTERPDHWWTRAAIQFRIGEKVSQEIRNGQENADWIKERVEHWVDIALEYYEKNHAEKIKVHSG